MAPIHHHFEKMGLSETQVCIRFWIVAFFLGLLGICTLALSWCRRYADFSPYFNLKNFYEPQR